MANLEEAVVATLFDQAEAIADEILHHNPLLASLDEQGLIRKFSGGYEIRKPIMYNDSAVGGFYSGMSAFNLDTIDDMTAFRFAIKQVYEPVAISGRDRRANRDDAMLLDLVESKMKAAVARLKNTVSTSLRGDGTGSGGLEFDGIKKGISTSPSSGTYGSIDRSANTWARNLAVNVTLSAANVQETITDTISQIARGDEQPDLGLMDRTAWKYLHSSLTAIQRIQLPVKKAVAGFRSLSYDGVDFVFDGGYGSAVLESDSCRLMNTKYWTFDMVRGADFKPLAPEMARPVDQDAVFTVIIVEGNLCCSAPALQAV
ncbi:phage major capsid protein, partial [bacterium]|nr:phage major capsid protein [bacterium]